MVAAAVVGSHARGAANSQSDVDLVILTTRPQLYLDDTAWVGQFGSVARQQTEQYGRLTSLRVWYVDGPEVEFGLTTPDWAALPLDEGTRRVIQDGMRVLWERTPLLSPLIAATAKTTHTHAPRRRGRPKAPTEPPAPKWQTCSLCRDIPDRCRAFWKGGDKTEDTIPPAVGKLAVVGAPFYDQETSHSNWCLLCCPECGTYYDWDFEYEYLVNGSEDDINVTRLSPEEGVRKAKMVADGVAATQARFATESPPYLEVLQHAANPAEVRKAASRIFMAQEDGNDLSAALPVLLDAWQRPKSQGDAASKLHLSLFVHGSRSRENLATLRAALAAAGLEARPEMKTLVQSCENVLGGR